LRRAPSAAREALQELEGRALRRRRRCVQGFTRPGLSTHVIVDGRASLNFCSNDYLGLARDPRLAEAMGRAAAASGSGSGAAHLVTGHGAEHHALEEELAAFTGREAALLFSTGYMANLGAITALAGRGEGVLQDRLNHASLLDAARLAGADLQRYAHLCVGDAAQRLEAAGGRCTVLATDGVFSMDGDLAPLPQLAGLARDHAAWFVVDDAHGLGVLGPGGRGSVLAAGLDEAAVPLLVGTLGKSFGSFGAFVAGPADLVELVMQRARSYIYTTALPPPVAAATRAALRIAEAESWRRQVLAQHVAAFRSGARERGLALGDSTTPIQPLLVGDAALALQASQRLFEAGYWVAAIRPPTVPAGTARLRVTLTAGHTTAEVEGLLDALVRVLPPREPS
jgi:8-amino-7-oxononanoate synthase